MPRKKGKRRVGPSSRASVDLTGKLIWINIEIKKGVDVLWPVELVSEDRSNYVVYVKSDNTRLLIKKAGSNVQPFPGNNFEQLKIEAIALLQMKRLKSTEMCFMGDIEWALSEGPKCSSTDSTDHLVCRDDCSANDDNSMSENFETSSHLGATISTSHALIAPESLKCSKTPHVVTPDDSENLKSGNADSSDNFNDSFHDEPDSEDDDSNVNGDNSMSVDCKTSHVVAPDDSENLKSGNADSSDNLNDSFHDEPDSEDDDSNANGDNSMSVDCKTSHVVAPDDSENLKSGNADSSETQDAATVHDIDLYDNQVNIGSSGLTSPDIIEETLNEAEDFFGKDYQEPKTVRKAPVSVQRCLWSQEEENEIKDLFKRFFEAKVRPKPSDCLKAIKRSKEKNGLICKRKKDVLKKKVFRMIDKLLS